MSPGGERVAVVEPVESRPGRVIVVDLADGTISLPNGPFETGTPVVAVGLVARRRHARDAHRVGGRPPAHVYTGAWTDTGMYFHGDVAEARWSTAPGRLGIAMLDVARHLDVHVDGVPDRRIRLVGSDVAFSPDGSTVVSVGGPEGSRAYGDQAIVWAVDVRGDRDPWVVATLTAPAPFTNGDDSPTPCVDWQPGGAP